MNYNILENVYLLSNGIIFDENMNLMKLHQYHDLIYSDYKLVKYNVVELKDEEYVDLTHHYSFYPFAHRYDGLSRIRHIENIIKNPKYLLGGMASEKMFYDNRFREEFSKFGVNNIIYHPNNETLFKIKKLIYPLWLHGESPCAFTKESFEFCKNKYSYEKIEKYKLFLSRYDTPRSIVNYEKVHDFFKNNGFVILNGREDLKTTINYFHNSSIIIGIHGGLFSNLLFCDKIEKIIEIFPSERYNGCFTGWNEFLKTDYENITIPSDKECNIHFKQDDLDQILNKIK